MRGDVTNEGRVQQFENGNISIRFSKDAIEDIKSGKKSDIEILSSLLDRVDTCFIGEQFCISNFDMGVRGYNYHKDKAYTISFSEIDKKLMSSLSLKIFAEDPTEEDLKLIEEGAE